MRRKKGKKKMDIHQKKNILRQFDRDIFTLVNDSFYDEREKGFCICRKKGRYFLTKTCTGLYCSAKLDCCEPDEQIASIHTHPAVSSRSPSPQDIKTFIGIKDKFSCIAEPYGHKFTLGCFTATEDGLVNKFEYTPKPKW